MSSQFSFYTIQVCNLSLSLPFLLSLFISGSPGSSQDPCKEHVSHDTTVTNAINKHIERSRECAYSHTSKHMDIDKNTFISSSEPYKLIPRGADECLIYVRINLFIFPLHFFFLFLLLSHLLRPCSAPPSFFPSDLLFLTSAVFFSPFLIPLSIFLDIFPFLISLFALFITSSFLHPLLVSNKGLLGSEGARLMCVDSIAACHLIYRATFPQRQLCVLLWGHFSARRLWSPPLSLQGCELTSLGPSAADKQFTNIREFETSSTLPHALCLDYLQVLFWSGLFFFFRDELKKNQEARYSHIMRGVGFNKRELSISTAHRFELSC